MSIMKSISSLVLGAAVILGAWSAGAVARAEGDKNILETAVAAGSFKTLAAALEAGGLVEALQGEGPFTVFAPTDEAFAKLPKGTLESLLKPENKDQLVAILKYHVVAGRVESADAVKAGSAPTLQGSEVKITAKGSKAWVNKAQIVKVDIDCSNGVIHVIDSVLLPAAESQAKAKAKAQ